MMRGGVEGNPLREAALRALRHAPHAFLRVDRECALYVSDAPRYGAECAKAAAGALGKAGFRCALDDGLMRITPEYQWMRIFTDWSGVPALDDEQLRLYERNIGRSVSEDEYALWIAGLKQLELGVGHWMEYDRRLRQTAAVCMRTGEGGGALYHIRSIFLTAQKREGME